MKPFFHTIKQTFSSKELYVQAQHESGWKGVTLLAKAVLFVGVVLGGLGLILLIAFTPLIKGKVLDFAQRTYPEGLVVTFADGIMTTNSEAPVIIPLPHSWVNAEKRTTKDAPTNLLVFAPEDDASLESLEMYDSVAVAGKKALIAGTDGEFRTYVYPKDTETVTKESFVQMVEKLLRVGGTMLYIMSIPMALLVFLGFAIGHLIWLLVIALVLWIIFKARKHDLTYKQVYKMGIYALVPVLLIDIVAVPLDIFGKVLTAAIVMVIVLVSIHKTSVAAIDVQQ